MTISDHTLPSTKGCPIHQKHDTTQPMRRTVRSAATAQPLIDQDLEGIWHVRGFHEARSLLRAEGTRQAGFRAEQLGRMPSTMRLPILFQEGEAHRDQRRKTARFFTPAATDKNYRELMTTYADEMVEELRARGRVDLSVFSMKLAVRVAAEVVGLTNSRRPGMSRRIEAFFDQTDPTSRLGRILVELRNQLRVAHFYVVDVQPAIRARQRALREDLISHLIEEGYSGTEVLTECVTFASAGMVTTREFISLAAWQFLEHPDLKERYLAAEEDERYAILHELLRLDPVVGRILRRAERDLEIESDGQPLTIPAGALIDLNIYDLNVDETAVGDNPLDFCPGRERARAVPAAAMSFGDGHHRCPGAYIAIQESDIFLTRLLALDGLLLEGTPTLTWNQLVKGYEIRDFWVRVG